MTTLIDRARKWGEERDQQWLEQGIEQGKEQGERDLAGRLVADRFGAEDRTSQPTPLLLGPC